LFGVSGVRADLTSGVISKIDSVNTVGNFVIITLNQSMDASRLQFRAISGGIVDTAGNKLDGEWITNSIAPSSGQGVAGGDYLFAINVLPGDLNGDGQVTNADTDLLPISAEATSPSTLKLNVNGNLVLNNSDRARVVEREGSKLI